MANIQGLELGLPEFKSRLLLHWAALRFLGGPRTCQGLSQEQRSLPPGLVLGRQQREGAGPAAASAAESSRVGGRPRLRF